MAWLGALKFCGAARCLASKGDAGPLPVSGRPLTGGIRADWLPGRLPSTLAGVAVDASGVVLALTSLSRTCCSALATISSCFSFVLARMGTRSAGTLVCSLKFSENFLRSLSLTDFSRRALPRLRSRVARWRSWCLSFSEFENCLKESKTLREMSSTAPSAGFLWVEVEAGLGVSVGCPVVVETEMVGAGTGRLASVLGWAGVAGLETSTVSRFFWADCLERAA